MVKMIIIIAILLSLPLSAKAQKGVDREWTDTLEAAIRTDTRVIRTRAGEMVSGIESIRGVVSPLGEGDPIKWSQTLPGVSAGADGGSAMFVRGGNSGTNLFSLDGVPVYGCAHLLGLTTIVPSEAIESASLIKGGFAGRDGNFTSAHLKITTKEKISDEIKSMVSVNNFLAGASIEGAACPKTRFLLAGRISPLAYQYALVRDKLSEMLGSIQNFRAGVGDVYAKIYNDLSPESRLSASALFSNDMYSFKMNDNSDEKMGWRNFIARLKYSTNLSGFRFDVSASCNLFNNLQEEAKNYQSESRHLSLSSDIQEYSLSLDAGKGLGPRWTLDWGAQFRYSSFNVGETSPQVKPMPAFISRIYAQAEYKASDRFEMMAVVKGNYYSSRNDRYGSFDPELNARAEYRFSESLYLEASFDRMVQYYHTLEGLPVGWSLDLIVPSRWNIKPEYSTQAALELEFKRGRHFLTGGAFFKKMDNLVYYRFARNLFSGSLAHWETSVDIGKGRSCGAEFLYEYAGKDLYGRVSYTLSKTDRYDFPYINDGLPFHAKFDRRHVLNAAARWKGINVSLIFQSGQWENAAAEEYILHTPDGEVVAEYFDGVNNYHMPDLIRLDLGYSISYSTGKVAHDLNLGVCNVLNRFNPFMLYYDTGQEGWKILALIPIMPNISYKVSF